MATVAMEEYELMKDSKYRMYVAAVDKALKNFEYTSEWADLISALGKLNKVLLGYTKFPVIPRRIKISKRLAQCMHPALPSGVHLKALETYDIIFKCMGTNRLSYELFIYSAGLFPLLGHAAMTIRPMLLQLYETHFVPLRERLRPALSGFLSGVLPGLETGSDHFDRTNDLLEAVCDGVGPAWFYTCIWQCVRSNSPIRLPAISYVLTHYSRKLSMEDQLYLMGNDIDVMVSGLCAAVQDSSVLVQRSALDLLMVCFPMHNTQLLYADMVRLVTAGLSTILRRDMSLNRRLYSWLLGAEINVTLLHSEHPLIKRIAELPESNNHTEAYFELYSYDILAEAIRVTLTQSSVETSIDIKPYRLLTSLFDKPQIGPVILDNILYDVFRALYLTTTNQQKLKNSSGRCVSFNGDLTSLKADTNYLNKQFLNNNCQELIKNANLLFNTLEPYYIWSYVTKLYEDSIALIKEKKKVLRDHCHVNEIGSGAPNLLEVCILTEFLLEVIHIETYADETSEILPDLFVKIVTVASSNLTILNKHEITQTLELCAKVLTKIQPITVKNVPKTEIEITEQTETEQIDFVHDVSAVELENSFEPDIKFGLEKSKSDSKINENLSKNDLLTIDDSSRERSNSNQMLKKKTSPKIEKKNNKSNKKSKSISKLYELKKDELFNDSTNSSGNVSPEKPQPPPPTIEVSESSAAPLPIPSVKIENKHLMRCLNFYKSFYVEFLQAKIAPGIKMAEYFARLVLDKDERTRNLESLLEKCLNDEEIFGLSDARHMSDGCENNRSNGSGRLNKSSDYDKAMALASSILLEFSTFPNLLEEEDGESKELPDWLRALIVCACGTHGGSSRDVQIISMNTLLELFSLAKSQSLQTRQSNLSTNNVVIMGILEYSHVYYIEDSTFIVEILSQILWDFLGVLHNQEQIMTCVNLLYQIHNIFDTKYFVEDVIANYLIHENLNVEFFKRFSLLWHLGRSLDLKANSNQTNSRNFDRSLLKILDNLQNASDSNLKLLAETFLTHTLLRNDIARVVSPMFTILLSPTTARISIRHINIQNADLQRDLLAHDAHRLEDAKFKKIYAISSVNGNVMYHVADEFSTKPHKRKSFLFSKVGKKSTSGVVNMTSSLTENSSVVTKKNKDFRNVEASPKMESGGKNNVKLFINPLSAKEIYPDGLSGSYTKLNNELHHEPPSSEKSSSESLSDLTQTSSDSLTKNFQYSSAFPQDRDSGFESQNNSLLLRKNPEESNRHSLDSGLEGIRRRGAFFEQLDSISDGINVEKKVEAINVFAKSHSFDEKNDHQKLSDIENSLVHSWSYCLSDSERLNCELEVSTPAEEFFKGSDHAIISELLNEILDNVCGVDSTPSSKQPVSGILKQTTAKNFTVYPMHYHVCLYYNVYDSDLILYSLETLRNSILSNPQLFVQCLATTGLKNLKNNDILYLLARHRKSLLGGGFGGEVSQEHVNFYRGYTFLDTVISICLNYARTFFPNLDSRRLTQEEICKNLKIQLASLEVLDITIKSIINIVKENSKGFASYIADMLVKCKLQKILLHCLLTSVRNFDEEMTFAEEILLFNNFQLYNLNKRVCEHVEAFQIQLLRLIQSLIILEYHVFPKQESPGTPQQPSSSSSELLTYTPTILIPEQQMFLSAIMSALRHQNMKCLHDNWCNMVSSCLPYFGQNLKQIALSVIHQICNNIEKISDSYRSQELGGELCSDYAVTQLNSLTILCHYCLLDSSQSAPVTNSVLPTATTSASNSAPISNPGEIFNNLMSVFFSPTAGDVNQTNKQNCNYYQTARKTILSHMPRIIISVAKLWQTIVNIESEFNGVFGNSKIVKQQLLEFLSPISIHHGASFLAAIAIAWYERRNPFTSVKTVLPEPNASQSNLVYLISAIRVIPLDNLVQTVTAVIKNPPPTEGLSSDVCLDVSVLELFYCYMRNASASQLSEAWSSLLTLVREGCALGPQPQFLLAAVLHELMIKCCPLEERKDQKDLQDVTAKLIECVAQVCGSCLEQTTWLRRNFAVKEQEDSGNGSSGVVNGSANSEVLTASNHSVHAQLVLSEILAPILDICFGSSEKDKVNTILGSLMYNIVPYLRAHTSRNMPSFHACSKLLASLSSYQYTRKAWKKDVFDLLLDNVLFQMDYSCLKYWKVIVDNLMTHDNTTFRDLMNRVSITQSGSLSLFSSKEQEYEQKAQLLKRLAFVIFCSETDQYSKYMPDIQEQLNANLRMNVPGIQAQVFLCFRVLLIRMSPMHVTSLWPIVISEMLQVFLQIEQELSTDTEEFRTNSSSHIKLLSALDASWATNSNNGLHALGNPHYMRLQLATAKLLDLALLLPATALPQFQMYRWAFVGDDSIHSSSPSTQDTPAFTPHVTRIAHLMDQKFTDTQIETLPTKQNELLLNMTSISQLKDLHSFFKTLSLCSNRHRTECSSSAVSNDHNLQDKQTDKKFNAILEKIDKVIETDFLEKIAR